MDSPTAAPAAPAQPAAAESTPVQTAVQAAVAAGNPRDYRAARRAERIGKPLAPVPAAADPAPAQAAGAAPVTTAVAEEPKLSRKEREQQEANERTRRAVDAATADLRRELDELRRTAPRTEGAPAAPAAAPAAPKPDVFTFPSIEEWAQKNPEKSLNDYLDARETARDDWRESRATAAKTTEQATAARSAQIASFDQRVTEADKATPGLGEKVLRIAQRIGRSTGPDYVLGQLALESPVGPQLLAHFEDHPEALAAIVALPESLRGLSVQQQIRAHIPHLIKEFGKLEATLGSSARPAAAAAAPAAPEPKTLTTAPAPHEPLGGHAAEAADPKAAAIRRGDTRAYRQMRRNERLTAMGR